MNNKGADQNVQMCILICTLVVHMQQSRDEGKVRFSRDEAHFVISYSCSHGLESHQCLLDSFIDMSHLCSLNKLYGN